MVLDEGVGAEDVGADLRAPLDLLGLALERRFRRHALLDLLFDELAAKVLERHLLVLELAALVLAGDDDTRREVRDTDGGLRLVDLLPACARGAVDVDADVLVADLHFAVVIHFGHDLDGGKGGLAALVGIEGRDAHETMHADLRLQIAVGVLPFHLEVHRFEAGAVAREAVDLGHFIAALFGIAAVHTIEHLAPVARLRAARARVQRHECVVAVVLAAEERTDAHLFDVLLGVRHHAVELGHELLFLRLFDEVDDLPRIVERLAALHVGGDLALDGGDLPSDLGGTLEILPYFRLFLLGL